MFRLSEKIQSFSEKFFPEKNKIIPFENGIDLKIKINKNKEVKLNFQKNEREIFNLASLLPEKVKIQRGTKEKQWVFEFDSKTGEGTIYLGKFDEKDFLLSFLHEAGHANDRLENELWNDFINKIYLQSIKIKDKIEKAMILKKEEKESLRLERRAWAFALFKARELEKKLAIKILAKIGGTKEVKDFIDSFLKQNHEKYQKRMKEILTEKEINFLLKK